MITKLLAILGLWIVIIFMLILALISIFEGGD